MKTKFFVAVIIMPLIFISCRNLLPSSEIKIKSQWEDFQSARLAYEKITPGKTTIAELGKMGFTPNEEPNIRIMNATEIINMFMPNPSIRIEDLNLGLQKCIAAKERCTAYKIEPSVLKSKRIGNFWSDLFTFKRHTIASGWEFKGLITIVDDVVTYRDPAGGRPAISTEEMQKKPLGPLQDIGGIITSAPGLWR